MRIGIFGSYNYTSIGDHAILEGILTQFRNHIEDLSVIVFSFAPSSTEKMLTSSKGVIVTNACPHPVIKSTQNRMKSKNYQSGDKIKVFRHNVKGIISRWPHVLQLYRYYRLLKNDVMLILGNLSFWRQKLKEIKQLDVLLIGGGNILMDLYPSWPIWPLIYSALGKLARIPVVLYAVGAGPIKTRRAHWYLRLACWLADVITLRDHESLDIVKQRLRIKPNKLFLSADPAICLNLREKKVQTGSPSVITVGMTVVPFYSPKYWPNPNMCIYDKYIDLMATIIESVIKKFNAKIILFATNHPNDLVAAQDVLQRIRYQDRIGVIEERLSVPELIKLIASCDVVIGTRLHSLILSLVAGTPFLAFSYQPKVHAFCKRIGLEKYVIPLSSELNVSVSQTVTLLQELIEHREVIQTYIAEELKRLRKAAELSYTKTTNLAVKGA